MKKTNSIKILIPLIIILGSIYALRSGVVVRKMPELNNDNVSQCLGICSDYIEKYKPQ